MEELGGFFGSIGLISIIYLALRPTLQLVTEQIRRRGKTVSASLKKTYQSITKNHRYAGFVAAGAIVVHFILQFTNYGKVSVTGLIAALTLAAQAILGLGLTKQKDKERRKKMALLHRILGIILVVAVLIHLIAGGISIAEG